ncbi:MAG: CoB--CoM heterodisulfide reductase iron-sulfur subunit A family protein [Proteobacteria bacterium]|nr:CoB--CoM heterodisulfide reductase iron-sulfur subunit A family protein [Pseudomonadota bacterium]
MAQTPHGGSDTVFGKERAFETVTNTQTKEPTGAVMVVGGGIGGMQASIDLAESGYLVYLVERKSSIGGRMSQLDKTFPTNDCAMCMLSPRLIGCASHPNINIITLAELIGLEGSTGNLTAHVKKYARYVDEDKCVGCGICAQKCPVNVDDEYNEGLQSRKAIYLQYPQAVPLVYAIDRDHCIYFKKGKCRACEKFCKTNAIDFNQTDEEISLKVGSVILAPGFDLFKAERAQEYGYGRYQNVVTTMEFERFMSATGPSDGHILRPSDRTVPEKVAWIQCVGSRESIRNGREFCSSICCVAATKEAVMATDHHSGLKATIFYIDLRAQGKGFDAYCERAKKQSNVRYVRSMISRVAENPITKDLVLSYQDPETGKKREETFSMVVLSVGLAPSSEAGPLAERLGIDLNPFGFVKTQTGDPMSTSREGVYVCGGFEGPKDIPETVTQASAAAARATLPIASVRGYEITLPSLPPERSLFMRETRIGVFVCCCGTNIAGVVDVEAAAKYARQLPGVVLSDVFLFACSTDSKVRLKELIEEHDLNRVVIASCSPKTHEPLFRATLREAGLNAYLLEMANIRNQCSWVHADAPASATRKAKDLIRMSVKRVALQEPITSKRVPVVPAGLVVGGGLAGLTAALTLADQGFETHVVEQSDHLGGRHIDSPLTLEGFDPAKHLRELIKRVEKHSRVTVHTRAVVEGFAGHVGSFLTSIRKGDGTQVSVRHGTAIIATGAEEYRPDGYLYGRNSHVITQSELNSDIEKQPEIVKSFRSLVMIQCVGSRTEEHPYCSRVCCSQAIANSIRLKNSNPDMDVIVLYRDIRSFGFKELFYKEARKRGVIFVRYEQERPPQVFENEGALKISFLEPSLRRKVILTPDRIVLSAALRPHSMASQIAGIFKVARDDQGFLLEAHVKLRPLDFATDGMFLCGDGHSPKFPEETIAQAAGAAGRAMSILSKDAMYVGPSSQVDPDLCAACMTCVRTCPYHVPFINEDGVSQIDPARCKGCGMCAAECPAQAITVHHYTSEQIEAKIQGLFEKEMPEVKSA